MAHTSSSIDEALIVALNEAKRALMQQKDFAGAVDNFQRQLLQDLEKSRSEVQSYFSKVMHNLEVGMQSMFGKISTATRNVESDIAGISHVSGWSC